MAVTNWFGMTGVSDGGFGGSLLSDQVQQETEEQRRKRLLGLQQNATVGQLGAALGSLGLGSIGSTAKALGGGLLGR